MARRRVHVHTRTASRSGAAPLETCDNDYVRLKLQRHFKFSKLTPIQGLAYPYLKSCPWVLGPFSGDVILQSPTGQGKTLAYVAPIVASMRPLRQLQVLTVAPTRELVAQIFAVFSQFSDRMNTTVLGGNDSPNLSHLPDAIHADAVISTPGTLLTWSDAIVAESPTVWRYLSFIVLDEVDRMLMSSLRDEWVALLNRICGFLSRRPRFVLATATVDAVAIAEAALNLQRPIHLVARNDAATEVTGSGSNPLTFPPNLHHIFVRTAASNVSSFGVGRDTGRTVTLIYLLHSLIYSWYCEQSDEIASRSPLRVVIFCNTKATTDRLAAILQRQFRHRPLSFSSFRKLRPVTRRANKVVSRKKIHGRTTSRTEAVLDALRVAALSGDIPHRERDQVMSEFQSPHLTDAIVLIASDVATRGLDFRDLQCIINYEPPPTEEVYVHRAGRTARCGNSGSSFTILDDNEDADWRLHMLTRVGNAIEWDIRGTESKWDLSQLESLY